MIDPDIPSYFKAFLGVLALVLTVIMFARCVYYAGKFDGELRRKYPDTVARLKARHRYRSWSFRFEGAAPLWGASLMNSDLAKDEGLRRLREKAVNSLIWCTVIIAAFNILIRLFG